MIADAGYVADGAGFQLSGGLTADALALDGRDDRPADLGALGLLPKSSSSSSSP